MAVVRKYYKRKNSSGGYDIVYLYTDANAVATTAERQFVSSEEKTTWNNKANSHSHPYLPLSGGTLNDGATIKLSTYGTRFITITGNSISADMSKETGGWAGNFSSVKDPAGDTTALLGWYGNGAGLIHIYMGGTYSSPYMKMTKAGLFTFANLVTANGGLQSNVFKAPTSNGGSTYGMGTNGQVLKSNGSTLYWGTDDNVTVDSALNSSSTNPVQNKVVSAKITSLETADTNLDASIRTLSDDLQSLSSDVTGKMPLAGGKFTGKVSFSGSTALPENTSMQYLLGIDSFATGGTMKWTSKANLLSGYALIGSSNDAATVNSIYGAKAYADAKIAALVDSAPDTLNTLKELAVAINTNKDAVTAINSSITNKVDKTTKVNNKALSGNITLSAEDMASVLSDGGTLGQDIEYLDGGKVDKVDGKSLSTNDFTNDYKTKLDGAITCVKIGSTSYSPSSGIVSLPAYPSNYIPKTTYEWSKELACGSNGKVCLGKFGAYDTNITINITSTTSVTYNATIVIQSQNIAISSTAGTCKVDVYGDANNAITPLLSIFRPYGSVSRQIEVYANLAGWSKNIVHVQAVALSDGGGTDILTSVDTIPTSISGKTKVTPTNVLKANFGTSNFSGNYNDLTNKPTLFSGNYNDLTNKPTSLPASDVSAWAKAASKPSYAWSEITGKPSSFTPETHTHDYLPLTGGTITAGNTLILGATSNANSSKLKWGTVNSKTPYFGYASDQTDGTFVWSITGTTYQTGLAIGGGSGNLLWKGVKVATVNDIPSGVAVDTSLSSTSSNAVANKAVTTAINRIDGDIDTILDDIDSRLPLSGGTMTGNIKYAGATREIISFAPTDTTWRGGLKYSWSSNTTIALWGKHQMSQFVWHAGTDFASADVNGTSTKTYDFQVGRDASGGTPIARVGGKKLATEEYADKIKIGSTYYTASLSGTTLTLTSA